MASSNKAKLRELKGLIAAGKYKELLSRLVDGVLKVNSIKLKYLYLKKKYSAFIADRVNDNLRNIVRGKTTDTPDIIWWLWLQGVDKAPDVCKACLRSLRRWYPDKKIITLDLNNLHEYITLPDYINEKYKKGIIDNTKYSNLVRLQLLIEYGGTWIDSTVFCTGRNFEYIMHLPLFMFRRDSADKGWPVRISANWFIVSAPHDPILTLTRDLHFQYWQDYDFCMHYFIFHMFFRMASEAYSDEWNQIPFISVRPTHEIRKAFYENYTEEKMEYLREVSNFHKLTWKLNPKHMPLDTSIYHHVVYDE